LFGEFQPRGGLALEVEEKCQIENDGELGDLRRLNADWSEANPAMRGMGLIEEECADQQEDDEAKRAVNNDWLAEFPVVHAHESEHPDDAEYEPDGLAQQEIVRMSVIKLCGDGGSAVDHDGAEQAETQSHSEQPTVAFIAS